MYMYIKYANSDKVSYCHLISPRLSDPKILYIVK